MSWFCFAFWTWLKTLQLYRRFGSVNLHWSCFFGALRVVFGIWCAAKFCSVSFTICPFPQVMGALLKGGFKSLNTKNGRNCMEFSPSTCGTASWSCDRRMTSGNEETKYTHEKAGMGALVEYGNSWTNCGLKPDGLGTWSTLANYATLRKFLLADFFFLPGSQRHVVWTSSSPDRAPCSWTFPWPLYFTPPLLLSTFFDFGMNRVEFLAVT